jgi:hypothetical protein
MTTAQKATVTLTNDKNILFLSTSLSVATTPSCKCLSLNNKGEAYHTGYI